MSRWSDNLYSGYQAISSALSSKSPVLLCKSYYVSGGAGVTVKIPGTFPPGTQNINATVYVVQQGAATTNDNITLYTNGSAANGQKVLQFLALGSAANVRAAPSSYIASAAAFPQPPATNQTNGGEIPFEIIVSSTSTAAYSVRIDFNRADTNTLGVTA
jgi:hypothetical protein